jgi:NAD dependent epimerase/dehydratase family enzyme
MLPAFWAGLGGRLGDPDRYVSWVGIDDVLGAIYHAIWTDALAGPVNVTAPNPATAQELADTLAATLNRPALLNLPAALVRAVGGEAADEMLLTSARVLPRRLEASGYRFADPRLDGALSHILGRADVRTGRRGSDTDEPGIRRERRPRGV